LGSYPLRADDPEFIGDYELLGRLGSGGMGTVFPGCTPQNRTVAIKVVRTGLTGAGITSVIARLAAGGHVVREIDPGLAEPSAASSPSTAPPRGRRSPGTCAAWSTSCASRRSVSDPIDPGPAGAPAPSHAQRRGCLPRRHADL